MNILFFNFRTGPDYVARYSFSDKARFKTSLALTQKFGLCSRLISNYSERETRQPLSFERTFGSRKFIRNGVVLVWHQSFEENISGIFYKRANSDNLRDFQVKIARAMSRF